MPEREPLNRLERRHPELVNLKAAADRAGVCTRTIRRWIANGRLVGYRVGPKIIRVDLDELDAMFERIGGRAG